MKYLLTEGTNDKTVVFTFGRMNPPTKGHEKLLQVLIGTAKENRADHVVYLSQTNKLPTDPLKWQYKRAIAKAAFPGVNISADETIKTPFQALEQLSKSYKHIIMVVGADRIATFSGQMEKYLEKFGIETLNFVNAGKRDADTDGIEGVSASKARELAASGDYEAFAKIIPDNLTDSLKHNLYDTLRNSLGIDEDANNKNAEEYRKKGLRGEFIYSGWG